MQRPSVSRSNHIAVLSSTAKVMDPLILAVTTTTVDLPTSRDTIWNVAKPL